jgi:hypothetical protein
MYRILMRLKGINAYLIVFVFLYMYSCTGTSKITDDQLLIQLEKTPCYGACPVYTIKIDQKGNGLFEGVENTEYEGLYSFRLDKKQLAGLDTSFKQSGFFEMEDKYHAYVSDLPTIYLTYHSSGKKKKIMDYYGAPRELKDLEKEIETLVLSMKMKKIK